MGSAAWRQIANYYPSVVYRTLKAELEVFSKTEELNGFQKWIISDLYKFDVPAADFTIRSILIIAIPHPFMQM